MSLLKQVLGRGDRARSPRARPVTWSLIASALSAAALSAARANAATAANDPEFTLAVRETADVWRNLSGGLRVGDTTLNKVQVSATWNAQRFSDPDFRFHLQMFRTNGERLTSHTGDVQTASNIEALRTDRLFEAWAEQTFGKIGEGGVAVRAGLIDLNSDFDSIDPASLFINSSHGIGPDLSKSGRNGPSIFPVSSAAMRFTWTPSDKWTIRTGAFDGVPGDSDHPKAFATVRLRPGDGALLITEADRKFGEDGQLSFGAWRYTARLAALDGGSDRHDSGAFGFLEGGVPGLKDVKGWLRAGLADGHVQPISGYFGAGLVKSAPFERRKDDRIGVAIARAEISPSARRAFGLAPAETAFETTYQLKISDAISLQPDVQYIVHPSSQAGIPNALAVGLRVVLTGGFPRKSKATDSADPTVPPDSPPPAEPANGSSAPAAGG